jgi:hypothetical protein
MLDWLAEVMVVRGAIAASMICALSCLGCASGGAPQSEIVQRGFVLARGWSVSELAKGPALIHVYTESSGGTVYIAPTAPNGDDCARGGPRLAHAALEPQRRLTVRIRDGEAVCFQTQARQFVELLWHAHRVPPGPTDEARPPALARHP